MRTSIVAANWKMHKTVGEAVEVAAAIKRELSDRSGVEIVICPPFTALKAVGDLLRYGGVKLGAQNMHWAPSGAYTGEVSANMLRDLGCEFVILGHSERRTHFGEDDGLVRRKLDAALEAGLAPIVCVGETLAQREEGQAEAVVRAQIVAALDGLGASSSRIVVAYEPVWAIGTGRTATPDQAQAAHSFIRKRIRDLAGDAVAAAVRIQYGGSVTATNAGELFAQPDVDGGLVGGASLEPASFAQIVRAAATSGTSTEAPAAS